MSDRRIEHVIGTLLQAGVLLSATVVLAGGVWLLIECGRKSPDYFHFRAIDVALRTPAGIIASLRNPDPRSLIQFGLLLLIATPVARVVLSLAAFAFQRDRLYILATLAVLAVLSYSLAFSH